VIKRAQGQEESRFTEVCERFVNLGSKSLTLLAAEPFEDEIHPRLRFAHRGIVGMANNGTKNSNDSQFFITLGGYLAVLVFRSSTFNPTKQIEQTSCMGSIHSLAGVWVIRCTVRTSPRFRVIMLMLYPDVMKIGEMGTISSKVERPSPDGI